MPSATAAYSNFGVAVLGHALAGAWGESYETVLRARVLEPLGLRDTALSWREADRERLAPAHHAQGRTENWDLAAITPAGGLVSSTRDLAIFLEACLGRRETPLADAISETSRPRVEGPRTDFRHGLGWVVDRRGVVWHNGIAGGYGSFVGYHPERKVGVAVLTNHAASVDALGLALVMDAAWQPPAETGGEAAEELKAYVGNYPLAPSFVMAVTADATGLSVQATNQPRLALRRTGADRFAVEGVAAEISFEREEGGKVVALVLHQNGMNQRAPRLAPGERLKGPEEIAVSQEELQHYSGRYRSPAGVFTVRVEAGRLMVQLAAQPFLQVFASAKDEFFYKAVDARISFERGADGQVTGLVLHQGGRQLRGERWSSRARGAA